VIISLGETHGTHLLTIYNVSHGSKEDYWKGQLAALFTTETGFYTKIGKVLLIPTLTKLIMPYVMRVYGNIKARYFG
jgi:hypothetical protein